MTVVYQKTSFLMVFETKKMCPGLYLRVFFVFPVLVFFLRAVFSSFSLFAVDSVFSDENGRILKEENLHEDTLLIKADQYFDAALYDRAIPLYQELLQTTVKAGGPENPLKGLVRYRLAQALFLNEDYASVINEDSDDPRIRYLIGLSYSKEGQYDKAAESFEKYLSLGVNEFSGEAHLELGKAYFQCGRFPEAKKILTDLREQNPSLQYLTKLYLARMALTEGDHASAEDMLSQLMSALPANDLLRYEAAYLRGEAAFQLEDFAQSSNYFEKALPFNHPEMAAWYPESLYHLGWSYVKLGDDSSISPDEQRRYFEKGESVLKKLLEHAPDERSLLALGQCYLARARQLKEEIAYQNAEILFSRTDIFISQEARGHALLLLAEAAPTYLKRDTLYRHLTQDANRGTPFYSKGWYLRGLNDLEEGKAKLLKFHEEEARKAFDRSASSFQKAFELLRSSDRELAGLAMKYQVQALIWQGTEDKYILALAKLNELRQLPNILMSMTDPDEIYYLEAMAAARLAHGESSADYIALAMQSIQKGLELYPKGQFADAELNLLGTLYYQEHQFVLAEEVFSRLATQFPISPLAGEALFWAARSADGRQDDGASKNYRRQVFEKYPNCCYAAEAYFTYYSYRNYLQGDRAAIKHLQAFSDLYPQSPFLIHSSYLIGLDYKRDRKTQAGKWIRKKNMMAAIDAFQQTEVAFDTLYAQGLLPNQDLDYLTMIRYRAVLERARANLAVADESQGAKRQIYFEYAEEVLRHIVNDCDDDNHPLKEHLANLKSPGRLEDESSYWLAQACSKSNNDAAADQILNNMIEKYQNAKITRGYFLSRTWYDKGLIAMRRNEAPLALQCFQNAEEASKGNVLSTDERLDLWIQQSLGYQAMHDLDNAILILSKVVNDDSISSLRVKAMYLRSEAYELQGRRELARKQLEATARKGGEWAIKAKDKLDKQYGYQ